jgi:glycosyltransferase involved in cell wall biosynthesis
MHVKDRPLRVAMMLEVDTPGGAENVVFDLAVALRERGHAVHPVGPEHGDGWLGEKLRASGFETHTFHLDKMLDWRCLRDLTQLFRRLDVDVVHGHEFDGAVYGAAAARLAGRAHVTTLHGNQTMTAAWRRRVALRWSFRRSQGVVAVSNDTKHQLERDLELRPDAIQVIRNGVPLRSGHADEVRRELGVRPGEVVILSVGNLVARKGHIFLLRALQLLEEQGLSVAWRLAIAGGWGGEARPGLESFAAEHGMADRVHILTYRNDVPDLLAAADVFVMPSLWEGLPLAVLEAMQVGLPILASEISGIPEAIVTEEQGLLVAPGEVSALAEGLGRLLRDPGLRERLGRAARDRAMREFSIDAMTEAYEALYRSALTERTAGSSS